MARVVFMGTPEFAVPTLQTLISSQRVVGVVTQPDRPSGRGRRLQPPAVKKVAQAANIPVYQPESLRSDESTRQLRQWQPDIIVVAAFGQLLRRQVLDLPPKGCLNIHASLLPRWRGASPIQHAILAGDSETGVTLMQMDEGMDTGPIYAQLTVPIFDEDTAASLHDRLAQAGAELTAARLDDILSQRLPPVPQNDEEATYAPMIKKSDGEIDWRQSAEDLDRHIRAMTPWPGAFTNWSGNLLRILSADPLAEEQVAEGPPGSVHRYSGYIVVVAGSGGLRLTGVQLSGKQPLTIDDFVNGQPEFIGSQLG